MGSAAISMHYQDAGLDPQSAPPEELLDLVKGLNCGVHQPLARAPMTARARCFPRPRSSPIPCLLKPRWPRPRYRSCKMKVPVWAVMARIMWHAGYHPEIENYRRAKARAAMAAADILLARAEANQGDAVLVAHGYFNAMIGRVLSKRGFSRTGSHRVRFWNAVVYERMTKSGW